MAEEKKPIRKNFEFAGITQHELDVLIHDAKLWRSESECVSYAIHRLYEAYMRGEFAERGSKREIK